MSTATNVRPVCLRNERLNALTLWPLSLASSASLNGDVAADEIEYAVHRRRHIGGWIQEEFGARQRDLGGVVTEEIEHLDEQGYPLGAFGLQQRPH